MWSCYETIPNATTIVGSSGHWPGSRSLRYGRLAMRSPDRGAGSSDPRGTADCAMSGGDRK